MANAWQWREKRKAMMVCGVMWRNGGVMAAMRRNEMAKWQLAYGNGREHNGENEMANNGNGAKWRQC